MWHCCSDLVWQICLSSGRGWGCQLGLLVCHRLSAAGRGREGPVLFRSQRGWRRMVREEGSLGGHRQLRFWSCQTTFRMSMICSDWRCYFVPNLEYAQFQQQVALPLMDHQFSPSHRKQRKVFQYQILYLKSCCLVSEYHWEARRHVHAASVPILLHYSLCFVVFRRTIVDLFTPNY